MTPEQQIAELKAEVAELKARLSAVESRGAVVVVPTQIPVQQVPAYAPYREWNWKPYVTCNTN